MPRCSHCSRPGAGGGGRVGALGLDGLKLRGGWVEGERECLLLLLVWLWLWLWWVCCGEWREWMGDKGGGTAG